jgi:hypothetical protein
MLNDELINIVLAPNSVFNEESARKLADILKADLYHARAVLNSKIPRIIFRQKDLRSIEDMSKKFKELGLLIFYFKDSKTQKPLQIFKANSLEFELDTCVFKDKGLQTYRLERQRVFLILRGNQRIYNQTETITTTKKLNVPATLLLGGIPIMRKMQEMKTDTRVESEGFVRVFEKDSKDFCVEIKQQGFNYACLRQEMAASSKQNIILIANKIRDFFPEAIFDESLSESGTSVATPFEASFDVNCKLVYMYHESVNVPPGASDS